MWIAWQMNKCMNMKACDKNLKPTRLPMINQVINDQDTNDFYVVGNTLNTPHMKIIILFLFLRRKKREGIQFKIALILFLGILLNIIIVSSTPLTTKDFNQSGANFIASNRQHGATFHEERLAELENDALQMICNILVEENYDFT